MRLLDAKANAAGHTWLQIDKGVDTDEFDPYCNHLIVCDTQRQRGVCSPPARDVSFHTADLFQLMPLSRLDGRYARHYLKEGSAI